MEEYDIRVVDWDKYQPRTDRVRHPCWFKMENDMPQSEAFFGQPVKVKWLWVCLLATSSKKKSDHFKVRAGWLSHFSGIDVADLDTAVLALQTIGMIECAQSIVQPIVHSPDSLLTLDRGIDRSIDRRSTSESTGKILHTSVFTPSNEEEKAETAPTTSDQECLFGDPFLRDFLKDISFKGQQAWAKAFAVPPRDLFWMESELKQAAAHWEIKPRTDPKPVFIHNWLRRSSERQAKASGPTGETNAVPFQAGFKKGPLGIAVEVGKDDYGMPIYGLSDPDNP